MLGGMLLVCSLLLANAPAAEEQLLLVYDDGFVEEARIPLGPDQEGASHAWRWTASTPPHRLARQELEQPRRSRQAGRPLKSLTVEVAWGKGAPDASAEIVAAPVEMWLEIPEHLLPAWDVPPAEDGVSVVSIPANPRLPWRIRLRGQTHGSWWMDIPPGKPSVAMTPVSTSSVTIEAFDRETGAIPNFGMSLLSKGGAEREDLTAQFWSNGDGIVTLSGVPGTHALAVVITAQDYLSRVLNGRVSSLPTRIYLEPGASIFGRVIDNDDRPLEGAEITVEAFLSSRSKTTFRETVLTDGKGKWHLANVPLGSVALRARVTGHAPFLETVEVNTHEVDMGTWVLQQGGRLQLVVVDDVGEPVAGATVTGPGGVEAFTDKHGRCEVFPLDIVRPSKLHVSAAAHLDQVASALPSTTPLEVAMTRAYQVIGRLVDAEGTPVERGNIRIEVGRNFSVEALQLDGGFLLDLTPGQAAKLSLSSPATREVTLSVEKGAPGGYKELGDITALPGLSIIGRVIADGTGEPIPSVRLWAPRPSLKGPLVAWAQNDLLEATTDSLGSFELRGLPPGRTTLRTDGASFARLSKEVQLEAASPVLDVGDLHLQKGGTVVVHGSEEADIAKLDTKNRWIEIDMLEMGVIDGQARFTHVPPGNVTVTLWEGPDLLCEEKIRVGDGEHFEVECDASRRLVSGTVTVGGQVVGAGHLIWTPEPVVDVPAMIINTTTPGGLRQQSVLGGGRPAIQVMVDASGFYSSDRLMPGDWAVAWSPAMGGGGTLPRNVEIPEDSETQLNIDFPNAKISGWVTDESGQPVKGARVTDLSTQALAFSDGEGRFELGGLTPGLHQFQAREADRVSNVAEITLHPGELPDEEIHFVLRERNPESLNLLVLDSDSQPIPNAIVFFSTDQKIQVLTSDREGQVTVPIEVPKPTQVRAAAWSENRWILGNWFTLADALENGILLVMGSTGSLELFATERQGTVQILSFNGWNVTWMLTMIGQHPMVRPGTNPVLHGLPAGELFTVTLSNKTATIAIEASKITAVPLD